MIAKRIGTLSFARKHLRLEYGMFDPDRLPMIKEPLEIMDSTFGKTFLLLGSVQSVKTLALQAQLLRSMHCLPRRSLWYSQTVPAVRDFVDDKFNPLFDGCSPVHRLLFKDKDKRAKDRITYREGSILFRSANIKLNRISKSGEDLYIDEPWTYEPGWLTTIKGRSSSYETSRRIMLASNGPDYGGEVWQDWQDSDKRVWHGACPVCGSLFPWDWGDAESDYGMKWEVSERTRNEDLSWNKAILIPTIRYRPKCCGEPLEYSQLLQKQMLAGGRYVPTNSAGDGSVIAWQWNALAHKNWSQLVLSWLDANLAKRRGSLELIESFKREELAESFSETLEIKPAVAEWEESGYNMLDKWDLEAVDPQNRPYRFASVDVQKDHLYVSIRKWSRKPILKSRLHYAAKVYTAGDLRDLFDRERVFKRRVFVDSGYNTDLVFKHCSLFGWLALDGVRQSDFRHEDNIRRIYSELRAIDAFEGTIHAGSSDVVGSFLFSTHSARNRFEMLRSEDSGDGKPIWSVADDTPGWYRDQIGNVVKVKKRKPRGGAFYFDYIETGEDHAHDLEVMHTVSASMAGFVGAESIETQADGETAPGD